MSHGARRDCDDELLLSRSRDGDIDAFGELVRRHQHAATRVAAVIVGSSEEARDIVQDAFVKAHAHLGSYRARGSVRSWMLRIVANESKNHLRSRDRRRRRDDRAARSVDCVVDGADVEAIGRLEHDTVMRALQAMDHADREILGCRYVAGLNEAATAAALGLAKGTVKSRSSRALGRLRSTLESSTSGELR